MRVLIAGAGIAGVAAARGFLAAGHEVTVLERSPALRETGCAIMIWHNGTTVLRDLGVRMEGAGQRLDAVEVRSAKGRRVMVMDLERLSAEFGAPVVSLPRRVLLDRLAEGLPEHVYRFGARVTGVHDDGRSVRVRTEDGAEHTGDLLIGADGVNSQVRSALFGHSPAHPTGTATWQGLIKAPFDPGTRALLFLGRQGDFGLNPSGDGTLQWLIDFRPRPGDVHERRDLALAALRRRYGSWGPPVPDLLEALSADDIELFPHRRHRAPLRWRRGRTVLIGDAAHAMPPTLAQGAGQGLEDVSALLRALAGAEPDQALDVYERRRRRQATLASVLATRAVATGGPRALLTQSEWAMRGAVAMPAGLGTWMLRRLLRGVSTRL
ncbi:FAD-dependent monooxygenase [Nonomuraea sp. PA05]|uniref:FAD-dependent monooxygenase n=1 Tax=Nonomuraea sp. PA05 TaxID=2604466 RepID=UPI0011DA7051|nr:NAD(P)/FAD-dependent oxidoreductase [Nonomuraea sp. PA05]TYB62269.1 FAD-dependent monooxygenase [Nonomuraea sp. PA05]